MRTTRTINSLRFILGAAAASASVFAASSALAAPAAPAGAHPRIWLTPSTVTSLKANLANTSSAASKAVAKCDDVVANPDSYTHGIYQGQNWAFAASSCGMAWQLTQNPAHAAAGVKMLTALLNDYQVAGDGAGGDTVVQHDTGYAIRFFAAHSALAYDWLHDAPGASALLPLARSRFKAWIDWYTTSGYLNDVPGANYHAGYVYSKTLVSIAMSGEDDGSAATYWADVNDKLFKQQIIGKGLGAGGVLNGGDWAEGWEYGPLSVVEYALSARALEEQGASLPEMHTWASDIGRRFMYGLTPGKEAMYVGGDIDITAPHAPSDSLALIATLAGPGSDEAAGWAKHVRASIPTGSGDDCPVYDALAEARQATDTDFTTNAPPTAYLAAGTRNLYARSGWDAKASWAVFTSAPRLVPDHQHPDASNFVLSRGGDHLVVDPSPYGTQSTLTSNAAAVDSNVVLGDSKPSQTSWSTADMPWARQSDSGIVAARSNYSGAFNFDGTPSDVAFARREFVYLPEGEVVAIDRARTGDASRGTYVRFRTPGTLSLTADGARATVGTSDVAIHPVVISSGSPAVRQVTGPTDCYTGPQGSCTATRFAVGEYSVKVGGPSSLAIHVIDALANGEAAAQVAAMDAPSVDASPSQNAGVIGVSVLRNAKQTYVLGSSGQDGACTGTLEYGVPGQTVAHHVVFDAPEDATGGSTVVTSVDSGRCKVTISAGGSNAFMGRPLMFSVGDAASGCQVTEDKAHAPTTGGGNGGGTPPNGGGGNGGGGTPPNGGGGSHGGGAGGTQGGSSVGDIASATGLTNAAQGCACSSAGRTSPVAWAGPALLGALALAGMRRIKRRRGAAQAS